MQEPMEAAPSCANTRIEYGRVRKVALCLDLNSGQRTGGEGRVRLAAAQVAW